jgi:hypothetical protein
MAIPSVNLGYFAIRIYDVSELAEAQIGYSADPSGTSLIDENSGSWQRNWVVIGYEDGAGDPIFIDSDAGGFPVYTAMHGTGTWEPSLIATGLRTFAIAIREIARIAERRENPVQLTANPIELDERTKTLERIQRENIGIDTSFWENFMTTD